MSVPTFPSKVQSRVVTDEDVKRTYAADAGPAPRDPARDLVRHDAYHALAAAGALLRTGLTGTNVMDVAIGIA